MAWVSERHPGNHDTLEGLAEIGGDGEGGWEGGGGKEGGEWWLLGCGIGVTRKERLRGAPSEVLVFAAID